VKGGWEWSDYKGRRMGCNWAGKWGELGGVERVNSSGFSKLRSLLEISVCESPFTHWAHLVAQQDQGEQHALGISCSISHSPNCHGRSGPWCHLGGGTVFLDAWTTTSTPKPAENPAPPNALLGAGLPNTQQRPHCTHAPNNYANPSIAFLPGHSPISMPKPVLWAWSLWRQ